MQMIDLTTMTLDQLITYLQCAREEIGEDVEIIFEDIQRRQFEWQFICETGAGQHKIVLREVLWDRLK